MKIKTDKTLVPNSPHLIVEAENEIDKALLKGFLSFLEYAKSELKIVQQNKGYQFTIGDNIYDLSLNLNSVTCELTPKG